RSSSSATRACRASRRWWPASTSSRSSTTRSTCTATASARTAPTARSRRPSTDDRNGPARGGIKRTRRLSFLHVGPLGGAFPPAAADFTVHLSESPRKAPGTVFDLFDPPPIFVRTGRVFTSVPHHEANRLTRRSALARHRGQPVLLGCEAEGV